MFESVIARAKLGITSTFDTYLNWAAVYGLAIIGGAFAVAALMLSLIENFGSINACLIVAALFAVAAIISRIYVKAIERRAQDEEPLEEEVPAANTSAAADPFALLTPDLAMTLLPVALGVFRSLGKAAPLIVVAVVVFLLTIGKPQQSETQVATAEL